MGSIQYTSIPIYTTHSISVRISYTSQYTVYQYTSLYYNEKVRYSLSHSTQRLARSEEEIWIWRLGVHGPQVWVAGQGQHDEGREVLQDCGGELLGRGGETERDGQRWDHCAGPVHSTCHVQLLGQV